MLVLLIFALVSCASWQAAKEQPFSTWSSKKKMTYTMNVYKTEYDRYMAAVIMPDLTEGQKAYLKQKRKALVGLDKTIQLLIPIVESGSSITPQLESQLLMFLNQLGFQPM
jgi:hypothetical protein